jgi:hypothetical protein
MTIPSPDEPAVTSNGSTEETRVGLTGKRRLKFISNVAKAIDRFQGSRKPPFGTKM